MTLCGIDARHPGGMEAIRAAGAASRIIADANAEIGDIIVEGYEDRRRRTTASSRIGAPAAGGYHAPHQGDGPGSGGP